MRRDQVLSGAGTNGLAVATNAFGFNSNRFGINTNRFQTNFLANGATNAQGISPTSRNGMENRIYSNNPAGPYAATNRLGPASGFGTNASVNGVIPNATLSTADRTVLLSVREAVQGAFAPAGVLPMVNYVVAGGVVTLLGSVPTVQESQAVQTVVAGVPGVSRVVNNLQVNNSSGATASNSIPSRPVAGGIFTTGTVSALNERHLALTNGFSAGSTNLTPTSLSNNPSRIYRPQRSGLPPGLQNREVLPPGLQNREQLPPGLSNQTNGTSGTTP